MDIRINLNGSSWSSSIKNIYFNLGSSWATIKSGFIKVSGTWQKFFSSYSGPTQLTSPTLSGTGAALTNLTGTSGTYQSGTYISKTSYIGVTTSSSPQTDGLTTSSLGAESTNPYTITQSDATNPSYYFYYVDAVTGNDSQVYYYYSTSITSYIPTVTDNFNRSVSSGLGTMSSGFTYGLNNLDSHWKTQQISGSNYGATVSALPASNATPLNYPLEAIELTGKTDITAQIDIPYQGTGPGIAFWAASGSQWWAASTSQSLSSSTAYTCSPGTYTYYTCGTSGTTTVTDCFGATLLWNGTTQTQAHNIAYSNCGSGSCTITDLGCSSNTNYVCDISHSYGYTGSQTTYSATAANVGRPCALDYSAYPTFYYYRVAAQTTTNCQSSCTYETYSASTCSGSASYSNNTTTGTCGCGSAQTGSNCSGSTINTNSGGTGCGSCAVATGTVTTYYTDIVIYSASGSAVTLMCSSPSANGTSCISSSGSTHMYSSNSSYATIAPGRIKVVTSGNSVVVSAYDSTLTNSLGTLTYNATSPTKADANGSSYAGIIMTPSTTNYDLWADNLSIQ